MIAERTKAINAKDLIWIADRADESFDDAITDVFESVFIKKTDMKGDTINSPEGCNIKRYGVYEGKYGIYKERLHPLSTDVESEVAVMGKRPAYKDSFYKMIFLDFLTLQDDRHLSNFAIKVNHETKTESKMSVLGCHKFFFPRA